MPLSISIKRLCVCLAVVMTASAGVRVHAQTSVIPSLSVRTGQVIELTVDTSILQPEFSWILTKDRTFVNAQRNRYFQSRQIEPGTYLLDVNIQDPARTRTEYHTFQITVTDVPDILPLESSTGAQLQAKLVTLPEERSGYVHLPPDGGFVTFDARQSKGPVAQYNVDLDNTVDADGDGKFDNDADNAGTYSQQSGWPLIVFIRPVSTPRTITLHVKDAAGTSANQQVSIAFDGTSVSLSQPERSGSFTIERRGLTTGFLSDIPLPLLQSRQLLFEWDFGDGTKSLLDAPTHTYSQSGDYTVSLVVRDLVSSQIIFSDTTTVHVSAPIVEIPISSSASSAPQTSAASSATTQKPFSFPSIGNYVKVGLIVFFIVIIGLVLFAILSWIKKMTAGRLQQTLEKVEDNLFRPEKKTDIAETATIMPIKREASSVSSVSQQTEETVSDRERAQAEFKSKERDNAVPLADSGPVPSWLSTSAPSVTSGSDTADTTAVAQAGSSGNVQQNVPAWLQETPAVSGVPSSDADNFPPPSDHVIPETAHDAPTPDWLRQASESLTYEPTAAAGTEATDAVSGITPETFASPDATLAWALEAEDAAASPQTDNEKSLSAVASPSSTPASAEVRQTSKPQTLPASAVKTPDRQTALSSSGPVIMPASAGISAGGISPSSVQAQQSQTGVSSSQKRRRRRKKKKTAMLNSSTGSVNPVAPVAAIRPSPSLAADSPGQATFTNPPVPVVSTPATSAATKPAVIPQSAVSQPNEKLTQKPSVDSSAPEPLQPAVAPQIPAAPDVSMPFSAAEQSVVSTAPVAAKMPEANTSAQPITPPTDTPIRAPETTKKPENQAVPDDTPVAIIRADSL